ncbi:hypothetical protein N9L68_06210 [bacterium]|nr:hypothetical protein [bacterium]
MYGKQSQHGVLAFAQQSQAKAIAGQPKADAPVAKSKALHLLASAAKEEAEQARALAQEADQKAATNSKSFHMLASAAKEEAHHARARAQEAENEAAEYKDAAQKSHKWADGIWDRCRAALGHEMIHFVGPPMIPELRHLVDCAECMRRRFF